MPLADAKDNVDALGAYLSRQISEMLKELAPEVEIINPENLHVKSRMDSGGQSSESDIEALKQLAWSAGADICVLGDFAPYNDEIGISHASHLELRSIIALGYLREHSAKLKNARTLSDTPDVHAASGWNFQSR